MKKRERMKNCKKDEFICPFDLFSLSGIMSTSMSESVDFIRKRNEEKLAVGFYGFPSWIPMHVVLEEVYQFLDCKIEERFWSGVYNVPSYLVKETRDYFLLFVALERVVNIVERKGVKEGNIYKVSICGKDIKIQLPYAHSAYSVKIMNVIRDKPKHIYFNYLLFGGASFTLAKLAVLVDNCAIKYSEERSANMCFSIRWSQVACHFAFFTEEFRRAFTKHLNSISAPTHHPINSQGVLLRSYEMVRMVSGQEIRKHEKAEVNGTKRDKKNEKEGQETRNHDRKVQAPTSQAKPLNQLLKRTHAATQQENEENDIASREKFVKERTDTSVETPTRESEIGNAPGKPLPRRFQFKIKSKTMRKMFKLMGTGKYAVNLEKEEEEVSSGFDE